MMQQNKLRKPTTRRIHTEMDESISNKPKKYFYYRNKSKNRSNFLYRQG